MMRISVWVNSRPSDLVTKRPSPPKRLSTTMNTTLGGNTTSAVPRSGFIDSRLMLVGIGRRRENSLKLW